MSETISTKPWRVIAGFAVAMTILIVAVWVLKSSNHPDRAEHSAGSVVTAKIEQKSLTTSLQLPASYTLPDSIRISVPGLSGSSDETLIVTRPLPKVGQVVEAGMVISELNYRPIILVEADLPLHRQIRPGMSGGDVTNLQDGLRRMGQEIPDEEGGVFGPVSQQAIANIFRSAGYEPGFTQGSEAATKAAVLKANDDANRAYDVANAAYQRGEDATALNEAYQEAEMLAKAAELSEGVVVNLGEVVTVPGGPLTVATTSVTAGQTVALDDSLATLTGGPVVLSAAITPVQASFLDGKPKVEVPGSPNECTVGEPSATVPEQASTSDRPTGPNSQDTVVEDQQPNGAGASELELPVSCQPSPSLDLLGTDTVVTVTSTISGPDSLVVPATSLVYGPDAKAKVIVAAKGGDEEIPVTVLAEANGEVAIESRSALIRPGALVVVAA